MVRGPVGSPEKQPQEKIHPICTHNARVRISDAGISSQTPPTLLTHLRHVVPRDLALYCRLQRQLHEEVGVLERALEELDGGVGLEHEAAQRAAVARRVKDEEDGGDDVVGVGQQEGLDAVLVGVCGGLR